MLIYYIVLMKYDYFSMVMAPMRTTLMKFDNMGIFVYINPVHFSFSFDLWTQKIIHHYMKMNRVQCWYFI